MFLRPNRKRKKGEIYEYWTLCESVRTARGPRQRVVANLGKLPGLDDDERAGWEEISRLLDGRARDTAQADLFDNEPERPQWAQVNLSKVRVERVRQFGKVYVALALWRRLGLHTFLEEHARRGCERIDWATVACILSVGRFCAQSSELALSEHWYAHTALDDLLGVNPADVYLREREAMYIVGTPKGRLRKFEQEMLESKDWQQVEPGVEVKLVDHPDGQGQERYVLCRSVARHEKEAAMLNRQRDRLRAKLMEIDASLKKHKARPEPIERRVGKWLGRNTAAEKVFQVEVITESGWATGLRIQEDETKLSWAQTAQGAYLLRTNCKEQDPRKLWHWYIHLTEVEDAFRTSKWDLGLRPVFHHREDRVQAHILVCFLALAMWRSLEMWLQAKGLGDCARQVLQELDTIRSMDVVLPVQDKADVRLRLVAKPEKLAADLLARMKLRLPTRPKQVQNVVEKTAP